MDKMMKTRRLHKGLYETSNGFLVRYEADLEGQLKWAVYHIDENIEDNYLGEGYDQCFASKYEAVQYVSTININELVY